MDPAVQLSMSLSAFRRYNGSTDASRYLKQFEDTCHDCDKDEKWAIQNLDRFLDGAAKFWWQTNSEKYETMLEDRANEAADVWKAAVVEMSTFFSKETQKEEARRLLRETRFKIGDDPLLYVTQRCRYLSLAEPNIDEKDKVSRLIEGLPEDIRLSIMYARSSTVAMFTDNLRDLINHSYLGKTLSRKPETPNATPSTAPQPLMTQQYQNPRPQYQNPRPQYQNPRPQQPRENAQVYLQQFRTEENKPICFGCGKPGHVRRYCRSNPYPNPPKYGPGATTAPPAPTPAAPTETTEPRPNSGN